MIWTSEIKYSWNKIKGCKGLTYVERLKLLKLPSLVYRRKQADLILLFNMVSGRIQEPQCPVLNPCWDGRTRGHDSKLSTRLAHKDCRKFFFTNRVVHDWNNLPQSVVSSPDVATFRILLDQHFADRIYEIWLELFVVNLLLHVFSVLLF